MFRPPPRASSAPSPARPSGQLGFVMWTDRRRAEGGEQAVTQRYGSLSTIGPGSDWSGLSGESQRRGDVKGIGGGGGGAAGSRQSGWKRRRGNGLGTEGLRTRGERGQGKTRRWQRGSSAKAVAGGG
ncbi:uncharacterized protein A4U43_C10F14980 [Asparagus officinalis]|uniref:Uncharacterized protein n=1 Tax=Asparagus officinalis TaxID=4686 RepID=A0A5P1E634_ASPOF|nr:uncharacterized protein A4U43_C10F14980 [Asparagus officinalis]